MADADVPVRVRPAVRDELRQVDYLSDEGIAGIVYLADRLGKPVLVEGPAGTGKTQLAKSVAEMTGARLIRLQCYEGLDESKALYEWNYKKQLLRIQAERNSRRHPARWDELEDDIFSDDFLLTRPLLEAITADRARRAADRRGRPGRGRDRGAAARDPVRLPGVDPRAGHDVRHADPARVPHVEQHPRALRGAQAALPLPAHRLPGHGAREGDRAHQGARTSPSRWPTRSPGSCARSVSSSSRRRPRCPRRSTGPALCCCSASRRSTSTSPSRRSTSCSSTRATSPRPSESSTRTKS